MLIACCAVQPHGHHGIANIFLNGAATASHHAVSLSKPGSGQMAEQGIVHLLRQDAETADIDYEYRYQAMRELGDGGALLIERVTELAGRLERIVEDHFGVAELEAIA